MAIVAKVRASSIRSEAADALGIRPDINPPPRRRVPPGGSPSSLSPASAAAGDCPAVPAHRDYQVGYGRPPKHGQFKPGLSGNPAGRPKGAKGMKRIARDVLTEKVAVRTPAGTKRISKMEAMIYKKAELAFAGNLRAIDSCGALYQAAVPDEVTYAPDSNSAPPSSPDQLDELDQATLAGLMAMLRAQSGGQL